MKNWYNKSKLEEYKLLVEDGHASKEEYDNLEAQMKSFKLSEKEIVDKSIELFLSIPTEKEMTYLQLVSECLSFNATSFFYSYDLSKIYISFLKECKKRKIKIVFQNYDVPYNRPFMQGLWRTEKPLIKKIVYNKFYGCYGIIDELSRSYTVFENQKITYCITSLGRSSNKKNCDIKISYDPTKYDEFDLCRELIKYNFNELCKVAEEAAKENTGHQVICDAIPASIHIYYDNGKKIIVSDLDLKKEKYFEKISEYFEPNCFKQVSRNTDDEDY